MASVDNRLEAGYREPASEHAVKMVEATVQLGRYHWGVVEMQIEALGKRLPEELKEMYIQREHHFRSGST